MIVSSNIVRFLINMYIFIDNSFTSYLHLSIQKSEYGIPGLGLCASCFCTIYYYLCSCITNFTLQFRNVMIIIEICDHDFIPCMCVNLAVD